MAMCTDKTTTKNIHSTVQEERLRAAIKIIVEHLFNQGIFSADDCLAAVLIEHTLEPLDSPPSSSTPENGC